MANKTIVNTTTGEVSILTGSRESEIANHFHNTNRILGYTASTPETGMINSATAYALTGGNASWGTEIQITNGSVIESGSSTTLFDIGQINVPTIGTANRNTIIELYYGSRDAGQIGAFLNTGDTISKRSVAVSATIEGTPDTLTSAGNCPANDTRVVLDTIVTSTGISNDVIYYVVNSTIATTNTTFQLSLTSGGGAVAITGDGTCNFSIVTAHGLTNGTKIMLSGAGIPTEWKINYVYYVVGATSLTFQVALTSGGSAVTVASAGQITYHVLTQTLLTSALVCSATNTPQQITITTPCPRIYCNNRIWARAWSDGGTNALGLLFNYHTYTA